MEDMIESPNTELLYVLITLTLPQMYKLGYHSVQWVPEPYTCPKIKTLMLHFTSLIDTMPKALYRTK